MATPSPDSPDDREAHVWRLLYRVAETAATARGPAGLLPRDARDRRRADGRDELLHRALRRRAAAHLLPRTTSTRSTTTSRTRTCGSRSASATRAARRRTCCAPASRSCSTPTDMDRLIAIGEIELVGATTDDERVARRAAEGAEAASSASLVVQSYTAAVRYSEDDRDLLAYVAQHIGAALERVRALEETRQRTIELETVNSVVQALAAQLDLDALDRARRRADARDLPGRHRLRRAARPAHRPRRVPLSRRAGRAGRAAADRARRGPHRRGSSQTGGRCCSTASPRSTRRPGDASARRARPTSASRSCSATRRSA